MCDGGASTGVGIIIVQAVQHGHVTQTVAPNFGGNDGWSI